ETINVGDAPPQDEAAVVEAETRSVAENDLPHTGAPGGFRIFDEVDFDRFCRAPDKFPEIAKTLNRCEAIGLQEQLRLEVVDPIERMTISIGRGLPMSVPFGH